MNFYPPNQDAEICRKKVIMNYGSNCLMNFQRQILSNVLELLTTFESISHLASREKTAKTSKNALWSSKKRKNWTLGAYVYKYWLCSVHNCSSVFSDHSVCAFSYQHSHFDQKSLFLETGFLMSLICFSRADAGKASIWGWEEDQMDLHSYASV